MSPLRILIADDHATYVRTLHLMLSADPELEVVGTAEDGAAAVELVLVTQPDVVLMDVDMPVMSGIDATRRLAEAAPHVAVVVLTMFDDDDVVVRALQAGARGFVLKGARRDDIVRAVRAAHEGDTLIGGAAGRHMARLVSTASVPVEAAPPVHPALAALTERELDVLRLLARGSDNATIARTLYLSDKTVRNYVSLVLMKLGVASRTEAALLARDAGL